MLPIYSREFHGPQEVKFVKHKVPDGFGAIIDEFCNELPKADHLVRFRNMVEDGDYTAKKWMYRVVYDGDDITMKDCLKRILETWLKMFLSHIDELMVKKVSDGIIKNTENRCNISSTVYDFSTKMIDPSIINILGLGSNFVMDHDMGIENSKHKIKHELFEYLKKYRRYIHKAGVICSNELEDWLEIAIDPKKLSCPHVKFYSLVRENHHWMALWRKKVPRQEIDFTKLDEAEVCVMDCDKNHGIALIDIKDAVTADEKMISQLGGIKTSIQIEANVKETISDAIKDFEINLNSEARKFMDIYYPNRVYNDPVLPFMKLTAKIHKLSHQELQNRDVSKLKYRPVIDCSRTALVQYSRALMNHVKMLTQKLENKYFPLDSPLIKNGHEIAEYLKNENLWNNSGTFFAIADLSSAYSFVFLENLLFAMGFAARELEIPKWKNELFINIAKLVLNNSFVQTSGGFYKLSSCLPMGLNCSGECLDLVCLVSELAFKGKIIFPEFSPCSERHDKWTILDEGRISSMIIKYLRYRDDTFTYGNAENQEGVKDLIHGLGSAFLTTLDINVNLSHFVSSFLDCFFFKSITGNRYHTMVRRKGLIPVTFQHGESNSSDKTVKSIVSGEILRHRRLSSSEDIAKVNDTCLEMELFARGYEKTFISRLIKSRISEISSNYTRDYRRISPCSVPEGLVYGTKTVFDSVWNTHGIVKNFIKRMLQVNARLPTVINGPKLRSKYYTKTRYLNASRKFLRKKEK